VKIAVVFEPDPDLGVDPLDEAKQLRRQGLFIDSDKTDTLLVFREYGEEFEGGNRTHIFSSGIWENVDIGRFEAALDHIEGFGDEVESA
jgi:hypothetical protein